MDFFKDLNREQWLALLPFGIACGLVGFGAKTLLDKKVLRSLSMQLKLASQMGKVNPAIKKGESKVVDSFDIEDLGDKKVFCRCWRSSKFPYCDGSHNKYNEDGGDNVGPLIVKKKGK